MADASLSRGASWEEAFADVRTTRTQEPPRRGRTATVIDRDGQRHRRTFRDADGSQMNVFLLLIRGAGWRGCAGHHLRGAVVRVAAPGDSVLRQSIIAMGSASGLSAVGIFLFVVLLIGGSRRRRDEPFNCWNLSRYPLERRRGVSPCDQRAKAGHAGAASPGGHPS
jgi:hypothetical protein